MDDVLPIAAKAFASVAAGHDRLIVGRETGAAPSGGARTGNRGSAGSVGGAVIEGRDVDLGGADVSGTGVGGVDLGGVGRLAALAFITNGQFRLTEHWRTVKRVMVHPDFQGRGYGVQLMAEVERAARAMGLELLTLDCRGGTGNDDFYKKCGYVEYGRLPGALRLGAEDYRDQILMTLSLER